MTGICRIRRRGGVLFAAAAIVLAAAGPAPATSAGGRSAGYPCGGWTRTADGSTPANFETCAGGTTVVSPCPAGLLYRVDADLCDYPANVRQAPTGLAAGTARLRLLPLPPGVSGLTATLTLTGGRPVPDATIAFTTVTGQPLCSAVTDGTGHASCDTDGLVQSIGELLAGYQAVFTPAEANGITNLAPAQAAGTVTLL
ncbi:chitin-binding domain-containing protein [Streptomyces clavuligerus]|nr:chitin-binding domain-containing protein [Streptomyces clavuligerus]WDN56419.1 hypothetical protein LL058_31755 [Streptomyces clavuligerus]